MLKVAVCVSGGGTNLQAIIDSIECGKVTNTEIIAVISNNAGAKALERAEKHHIPGICLSPKNFESREAFNEAFVVKMKELNPDLIVLAGFLVMWTAAWIPVRLLPREPYMYRQGILWKCYSAA